jgi:eukaryotic-like serine/threonine-protein kinase
MKNPRGIIWCPHCSQPHRLTERICPATGKTLERGLHRGEDAGHALLGYVFDRRYRVASIIGQGGIGIVFAGEDLTLKREVAIKLVRHNSENASERLQREAAIIASLQHPNICDIYHAGVVEPYGPYIITQRLYGETIAERAKWQARTSLNETLEILVQLLSALHAAHARNIVHRDVKPQNVFLVERVGCAPLVKLLDFGLAMDFSAVRLTRPGKALGTPRYMAPEQLKGEQVSAQTDLFAVGIMAHEMLTGRHPFEASTVADMQTRVLRDDPERISRYQNVPTAVEDLVARAMAKDPRDRFDDAYQMQRAVLKVLATRPEAQPEEEPSSWTPQALRAVTR